MTIVRARQPPPELFGPRELVDRKRFERRTLRACGCLRIGAPVCCNMLRVVATGLPHAVLLCNILNTTGRACRQCIAAMCSSTARPQPREEVSEATTYDTTTECNRLRAYRVPARAVKRSAICSWTRCSAPGIGAHQLAGAGGARSSGACRGIRRVKMPRLAQTCAGRETPATLTWVRLSNIMGYSEYFHGVL
jgi:hypothetical protein